MEKWRDLNIKDKLAIITAIVAFVCGWGLSIAGFIIPPVGEVSSSVLWILGQGMIYASSVFGIAMYFNGETVKLRSDLRNYIEKKNTTDETETDKKV